jgi:uncharacterized delta-60 repeat protein
MWRSAFAFAFAACFDPSYSDATRCGPAGECPTGRTCVQGLCKAGAGGSFSLTVAGGVWVVRGRTATLGMTLTRDPGFTDPVAVSLSGLPAGVTATPTSITTTMGRINVTAGLTAPLGPATCMLVAEGGRGSTRVPVMLMIADPAGSFDVTFAGTGGISIPEPASAVGNASPAALLVRPNGSLIVAQDYLVAGVHQVALISSQAAGTVDDGFGTGGEVVTSDFQIGSGTLQPDGSVVAVGYGTASAATTLVRWDPTGTRVGDPVVAFAGTSPRAIAAQSDGSVVIADVKLASGQGEICRRRADLSADPSFAGTGCWVASTQGAVVNALAVGANDRIIGGGSSSSTTSTFYTVGLAADGSGAAEVAYPVLGAQDVGLAVTFSGSAPVVAGQHSTTVDHAALARTLGAGADPAFGGGIVVPDLGGPVGIIYGAATQADGKIVVVGENGTSGVCARLTGDGQPDTTFASGGVVGIAQTARLDLVAIAPDGRIVVAGTGTGNNDTEVFRIWP